MTGADNTRQNLAVRLQQQIGLWKSLTDLTEGLDTGSDPITTQAWLDSVTRPSGLPLPKHPSLLQGFGFIPSQCLPQQLAGRTQYHMDNWKRVTQDPCVLHIAEGYELEFESPPYQSCQPVTSPLNRFLWYHHFKMEGIHLLRDLLQEWDWMCRIDLKDTYFAVPITSHHQKYLRFSWKGQTFQFTCLPFRLSTAPRIFTQLLRPVVELLRSRGVRCIIYLDDILILAQRKDMLLHQTAATLELLESLGFLVNYKKSHLLPTQVMTFLGFIVDSTKKQLSLPPEKMKQIKEEANKLLRQEEVSARALACFIGKLTAAILAIYPAPLHYRGLQQLKHDALRRAGYDGTLPISQRAREDLEWWVNNLTG